MTAMAEATVTSRLSAAVDEVAAVSLSRLAEDELLSMLRELERTRRWLEAVETRLLADVEERNLPGKYVMRSTGALLAGVLNLSASATAQRVRHARQLGPRTTVTGERLAPLLPAAAAARQDGLITAQHASVIIATIDKLPSTLPVTEIGEAEAFLVQQAQQFDATVLAGIARQLLDTLNPDGTLADENWQNRHRFLSLVPNGDGMHRSPPTSTPRPPPLPRRSCTRSRRRTVKERGSVRAQCRQRMHDALRSVLKLALRARVSSPRVAGCRRRC